VKVILLNRYFHPDHSATSQILTDLAFHLASQGREVHVITSRQRYDERFERFTAAALRLVAQRAADIDYVDMRYTNGFAVGWRSGSTRLAGRSAAQDMKPDG
jgi:hypothetical protein